MSAIAARHRRTRAGDLRVHSTMRLAIDEAGRIRLDPLDVDASCK